MTWFWDQYMTDPNKWLLFERTVDLQGGSAMNRHAYTASPMGSMATAVGLLLFEREGIWKTT